MKTALYNFDLVDNEIVQFLNVECQFLHPLRNSIKFWSLGLSASQNHQKLVE